MLGSSGRNDYDSGDHGVTGVEMAEVFIIAPVIPVIVRVIASSIKILER
jgi:hypothetical protein